MLLKRLQLWDLRLLLLRSIREEKVVINQGNQFSQTPHCNDTPAMVQRKGIENCLWEFHKSSEEYPIVHCSEHNCIIVKNPKTGFISIMTYFAKGDHLQLIKVLKSHKLTD